MKKRKNATTSCSSSSSSSSTTEAKKKKTNKKNDGCKRDEDPSIDFSSSCSPFLCSRVPAAFLREGGFQCMCMYNVQRCRAQYACRLVARDSILCFFPEKQEASGRQIDHDDTHDDFIVFCFCCCRLAVSSRRRPRPVAPSSIPILFYSSFYPTEETYAVSGGDGVTAVDVLVSVFRFSKKKNCSVRRRLSRLRRRR